jgi:serine/threonine-protein kinase
LLLTPERFDAAAPTQVTKLDGAPGASWTMSSHNHGRYAQFAALDHPDLPERFQNYVIDKNPIGEGPTTYCFRARRLSDNSAVRLKVLRRRLSQHPEIDETFDRLSRLFREVRGDRLLQFCTSGQHAGIRFFEFEYVDATSLRVVIERFAPLHPDLVALIALGAVAALLQIHGLRPSPGLGNLIPLHRNLSPENVLLTPDGRVLLADSDVNQLTTFADRRQIELPYLSQTYESPEQLLKAGYADRRSDVYALGLIMLEAATACHPYQGQTIFEARQNVRENRPFRIEALYPEYRDPLARALVKDLGSIVRACTAFDADKRPASATDVEDKLTSYLGDAGYEDRKRPIADFLRAGTFQVERKRKKSFIDRLFGG